MRKMKLTLIAEFEIPDSVVLFDDGVFECEGTIFQPEISFDCLEYNEENPDEPLRFPNDIISIKEYDIEYNHVEAEVSLVED